MKTLRHAVKKFKEFSVDPNVDFKTTFTTSRYTDQMDNKVKNLYRRTLEKFLYHIENASATIEAEEYADDRAFLTHLVYLIQLDYFSEYASISKTNVKLIKRALAISFIESQLHLKLFTVLQSVIEQESLGKVNFNLKVILLNVYTSFTDGSEEFAYEMSTLKDFIDFIVNMFKDVNAKALKPINTDQKSGEVSMAMGVFYNCLLHENSKEVIKEKFDVLDLMQPFTASKVGIVILLATFSMALVADESQSNKFSSNRAGVSYAILSLKQALGLESLGNNDGWTAYELAKGIGRLAVNDGNKQLLVDNGAIEPLYKLSLSDDDEEASEACEALWNLAFKVELRKDILAVGGLKESMERLSKSDRPCQKPAQGLLWLLQQGEGKEMNVPLSTIKSGKKKNDDTVFNKLIDTDTQNLAGSKTRKGHIMISYQWGNQPLIKEIKSGLAKRGYNVWLDIEKMNGSTLEAMAEAVEQSQVILVCMSPKYKQSANCRMEAEYTLNCKKEFIPLIMTKNYKPDGWLGFMLGAKLFFDFSGKYDIGKKFEELLKEIGERGKSSLQIQPSLDLVQEVNAPQTTATPPSESVKSWGKSEINTWIEENNLSYIRKLKVLTGKKLDALKRLHKEAPEYFYQMIKNEFGIASLDSIADFMEAFAKI
ncbi:DgyrCDS8741 [Dimorphilus gyrociliatus]|uniref:DgyrCDS8741 n=1 Tax=Dimorphilus gyrociliatus TaxID=2664684 RepID=A0A7I8VXD9_9ANNE|nr:DgyrCDS8741 [Dimorphilus gyrociliatus]